MAMNTWQSGGAGRRRLGLGLGLVRIGVPSNDDIASLTDRLNFPIVSTSTASRPATTDAPSNSTTLGQPHRRMRGNAR